MSEFLHDDITATEQLSTRMVRLSEQYNMNGSIRELIASFAEGGIKITRLHEDRKPRSFNLSAEEMDSLAGDWLDFRTVCTNAKHAEELRLADVQAQIDAILAEHPEIEVQTEQEAHDYFGGRKYRVRIESLGFRLFANNQDEVLEAVQAGQGKLQEHRELIKQAVMITKQHPEIVIKQSVKTGPEPTRWFVHIPSLEWRSRFRAENAKELLQYTQDAVEELEASTKII